MIILSKRYTDFRLGYVDLIEATPVIKDFIINNDEIRRVCTYDDLVSDMLRYAADQPVPSIFSDDFANQFSMNLNPYEFTFRVPRSSFGFGVRAAFDDKGSNEPIYTFKIYFHMDTQYAEVNPAYKAAILKGFGVFDGTKARNFKKHKPKDV